MRKFFLFAFLFAGTSIHAQVLQSPKQFLGYELGERFTQHARIVSYFEHAAQAMPANMKLTHYGKTYEGRVLLTAAISTPQNIAKLDEIRKNSLRLSGQLTDKPADINLPAIVWLSYNVHGNEASSSEVSMKALYELLSPVNSKTNDWLKNLVVIIDPCLNPDGRDRYANWYHQVAGKYPDADASTREHQEPWPGGRPNHYFFDLNRDWAWQSQIESQQRVKEYNKWMPSVHVDFHEQWPNSPYYFAPAAEPLHEAITPFQRDFQVVIGKNHARYFDAKGWLYFTKEYFDLFYPAYGDTYPIYNGAIGMTYEQAGHGIAGLAIAVNGDTLRLSDRIDHHFTTTMSTIEVASENAVKLNTEFMKYFSDGLNNGNGEYRTYIVKGDNPSKLKALTDFFDRNLIRYGYAGKKTAITGFSYFENKDASYTTAESDLIVSSFQPKAALVRVLFEPKSKLSDSLTYDITAWALPYTFGLQSYAVKEKILPVRAGSEALSSSTAFNRDSYGYLISYNSFEDGKVLAALLKKGFKVRVAQKDFTQNGKKYSKGTIVILRAGNEKHFSSLSEIAGLHKSSLDPVASGFMEAGFDFGSDHLKLIKAPRVAMLSGDRVASGSAGEIWHYFEQQLEYPVSIYDADISRMDFKNIDVLIIPSGSYKFLTDKDGSNELKSWIRKGGRVIALERAVSQMASGDWGIKKKKEDDSDDKGTSYADLKRYENRDREGITDFIPGAIFKVDLDNSHPLAFGYPSEYFTLKLDGNMYDFMKSGWNVGVIKKESAVAGFVGSNLRSKIQDGTIFGVEDMGSGTVIYMADNPLFRSFWENGKLLFTNAVFLTGQ